ncbi:MAG: hypothetical protein SGCHY_002771 [Lobulomycetales sp.]
MSSSAKLTAGTEKKPGNQAASFFNDAPWVTRIERELLAQRNYEKTWDKAAKVQLSRNPRQTVHTEQRLDESNGKWKVFNLLNTPNGNPLSERPKSPYHGKPLYKITAETQKGDATQRHTQIEEVQQTRSFRDDISHLYTISKLHAKEPKEV